MQPRRSITVGAGRRTNYIVRINGGGSPERIARASRSGFRFCDREVPYSISTFGGRGGGGGTTTSHSPMRP